MSVSGEAWRQWTIFPLTGFLLLLFSGCAIYYDPSNLSVDAPVEIVDLKGKYRKTDQSRAVPAEQKSKRKRGSYILGPGDSLTILMSNVSNATYDVIIRPDGFVSLPIIDEVEAAGLTPSQLDDKLTALYSSRYVDPEISVMIRTIRQPMVYVLGEVRLPGSIPFLNATSAAEAIARVGDMLPTAYEKGVVIIRLGDDGVLRPIVVSSGLDDRGEVGRNYQVTPYMALAATQLEPEDILFVPENEAARLGTTLEQLLKPLAVTGNAASSVLGPFLQWKVLQDLDSDNISVSTP